MSRRQILDAIRKGRAKTAGDPLFKKQGKEALLFAWKTVESRIKEQKQELLELFRKECELAGGKVSIARDHEAASQIIRQLIRDRGIGKIMKWPCLFEKPEMDPVFESPGVRDVGRTGGRPEDAELGITAADFGIAESGTLVVRTLPGRDRSSSLLPPVHVAVLPAQSIVPDLDDLMLRLRLDLEEGGTPDSCLTCITGPSRTADIEGSLVLGIHGPRELHVIVVGF